MKKQETIGKIGERLFKQELEKRNIDYNCLIEKEEPHDYDFEVGDIRTEVKTTEANDGIINWNWLYRGGENRKDKFDVLVGIHLKDREKEKADFYIIPKMFIRSNTGIKINLNNKNTKNYKYYSQFKDKWVFYRLY